MNLASYIPCVGGHEEFVQFLIQRKSTLESTCLFLFRKDLKVLAVFAFLISSERLFHAQMVDGKKELKKILWGYLSVSVEVRFEG